MSAVCEEHQRGECNLSRESEVNRSERQRSERQTGALAIIADPELLVSIKYAANGKVLAEE